MWIRVRQGQREEIEMDNEMEAEAGAQAEAETEVKDEVKDNVQDITEGFKTTDPPQTIHILPIQEMLDIHNVPHGIKDGEAVIPADLAIKDDSGIAIKDDKDAMQTLVEILIINECSSKCNNVELHRTSKTNQTNSTRPTAIIKT